MFKREKILYDGTTQFGRYQVIEMIYEGRQARVLFTGNREAAFSGMPLDENHQLLFDYIQRFYEMVCELRPKRLLLIGGGTYTLPTALLHTLPDIKIDSVEIDPGLDVIAEAYFNHRPNPRHQVFYQEGSSYLKDCKQTYDMIIIDAFDHLKIPREFATIQTTQTVHHLLSKRGVVAMNVISSYYGRNATVIETLYAAYARYFTHLGIYPADSGTSLWMSQNLLLVGQKAGNLRHYGLRYGKLDSIKPKI